MHMCQILMGFQLLLKVMCKTIEGQTLKRHYDVIGGPFKGGKKGESADGLALFCPTIYSNSGLPNKATHGGNPLDKARNQGCDGRSSQGPKERGQSKGTAPFCLARCGCRVLPHKVDIREKPLGNALNQGCDGRSSQGMSTSQKGAFSDLTALVSCSSKGLLSRKAENGGKVGMLNKVEIGAENEASPLVKSWSQVVNNIQHKGFNLEYVAPCCETRQGGGPTPSQGFE
ncbi:hypothetical protein F0562_034152 [Nyssa sinensis]|uniref:Uncharacterized protein n=1 Tax=Nyssa sinensis TaxID=561372 RepID=A0A5J5AHX5_9ASTE|nr:hypothetical protein F0562_034152 [Nyssa sinensis]